MFVATENTRRNEKATRKGYPKLAPGRRAGAAAAERDQGAAHLHSCE
jgi:hypothetical protein